jgi:hypothetical protein
MSAKVTIETSELTLSKTHYPMGGLIDEAATVEVIVDLVDAYDAANRGRSYSLREHLLDALQRGKK